MILRNEFTDRWKNSLCQNHRQSVRALVWDAIILNFLMAACGLSAVLVTGSVHVRPDGVPAFTKLQSSSTRLSALAR